MDISRLSTSQHDTIAKLLLREGKRIQDAEFLNFLATGNIQGAVRRLEAIAAALNSDGVSINPSTQSLDAIIARVVVAQIERIIDC